MQLWKSNKRHLLLRQFETISFPKRVEPYALLTNNLFQTAVNKVFIDIFPAYQFLDAITNNWP